MIGKRKSLERKCLAEFSPAFSLKIDTHSDTPLDTTPPPRKPVIFASPHSGNHYPDAFIDMSRLSRHELRRNEDIWIDTLFAPCVDMGAALLSANFPRSFLDVNRAPDELLAAFTLSRRENAPPPTPRALVGLGVVPTIIAEGVPIYIRPPKAADIKERLDVLYAPYHAALKALTQSVMTAHGHCLLIDCHSMPGFAPMGARRSDIILGDRHGISCRPETMALIETLFKNRGYSVTRNYPYAGGYVTSHYANPNGGVETLQIEINRDLYVNPVTGKPKPGFKPLASDLTEIIAEILTSTRLETCLAAE